MARVLIVGYGNPLRGDDGAGWQAAERLSRLLGNEEVQVLALQQLTLDLVGCLVTSDFVIFIDACRSDMAGEVSMQPVGPDGVPAVRFAHDLDPSGLLASVQQLYGECPKALLVTVSGERFCFGEKLSTAVEEAMPAMLARIQAAVNEFLLGQDEVAPATVPVRTRRESSADCESGKGGDGRVEPNSQS